MKEIPEYLQIAIVDLDEDWGVEPIVQWLSGSWWLITSKDDPDTGDHRESSFEFLDDEVRCWRWIDRVVVGEQKLFRYEVNFPQCIFDEIHAWLNP